MRGNSSSQKLEIIIPKKRSTSTSLTPAVPSKIPFKLPPIYGELKERARSTNNAHIMKMLTSDSLLLPKIELKDSFSILNNYEIKQINLTPSIYLSDFELSLMDDCKQKYEKILKELNEVRSLNFLSIKFQPILKSHSG